MKKKALDNETTGTFHALPLISADSIRRVRESVDIIDVIGGFITLQRAGTAYKALCPFHKEKTPSFTVSPQRQTFKCFGCGVGGNAFHFLMEYEKLEFVDAVRRLAERSGIEIEYEGGARGDEGRERASKDLKSRLHDLMEWARGRYHATLLKDEEAAEARNYLDRRGLDQGLWAEWGIGYAPNSFERVLNAGAQKVGDPALLDTAGLTRVNDQGSRYDFFRGRILFPIRDVAGRTVAFGGRKLRDEEAGGKYINSPATLIYDKSRVLYGVDRLPGSEFNRGRPKGRKLVVVVEGYMDVIACHRAGVDCAVAPCGTAMTPEQLRTLARFADRIVLLMDADAAGRDAVERVAPEVVAQGLDVRVASLSDGKDPDEFLRTHPAEELIAALDRGEGLFAFKLRTLSERHDLSQPAGVKAATEDALAVAAQAGDEVMRDTLIRGISDFFRIDENVLRRKLADMARRRYDPGAGAENATPTAASGRSEILPSEGERTLLLRLLTHPQLLRPVGEFFMPDDFEAESAAQVYRALLNCFDETGAADCARTLDFLPPEAKNARALLTELIDGDLSAATWRDQPDLHRFDLAASIAEIREWHAGRMRKRGTPADHDVGRSAADKHVKLAALRARRVKAK